MDEEPIQEEGDQKTASEASPKPEEHLEENLENPPNDLNETSEQNETILEQQEIIQPDATQLDEITLDHTLDPEEQPEHEIDASFQNEFETTNEENILLNVTTEEGNLDTTDQTFDLTADDKELTQILDETNDKEDSEPKREEIVHQKKDIISKRKARNPNRFADGNLIPEEIDEEGGLVRSPGPPPLEPISQNLDDLSSSMHKHKPDILGTTSPDRIDVTLDEEYQDLDVEIKPSRDDLIMKYHTVIKERDDLQNVNNQLHHKLADYFRKKKSEEAQNQPLFDKSSQEQEQRYLKYLSTIEQLRKQLEREHLEAEHEIDDLKDKCEMKQRLVNEDRIQFITGKRDSAARSVSLYTGKAPPQKEIDAIMQREQQKEYEVVSVRLENIKLKNQLKKREQELKAKEELGEGLHMIDFEQLKIENQTYNEKIEERNEELMKLKKKINNTVQILTHVKEKLQFVLAENEKEKANLSIFDEDVKKNRDILNKTKHSRDSLRVDNLRLKQNSGLLGNTVLLRDFEECVDKNDNIESQIEHLKRKHAELVLNSKGLKQKIAQSKPDK